MIASAERQTAYPLGPALDFLQHLWRLNQALERVSSQMQRQLGITAQQRLIVRCVGQYPGIAAAQLASVLHLDPGTISSALRRLESKRVLARRRDPRDMRRAGLALTAKGRVLARPSRGTVEKAVERLLRDTGAAQMRSVKKTLADLTRFLGDEAVPKTRGTKRGAGR
jgi:DNA-binding MarR family transcriptional regulator